MISNLMFWSDHFTCKTCKPGNVIGPSTGNVNPEEKTEND